MAGNNGGGRGRGRGRGRQNLPADDFPPLGAPEGQDAPGGGGAGTGAGAGAGARAGAGRGAIRRPARPGQEEKSLAQKMATLKTDDKVAAGDAGASTSAEPVKRERREEERIISRPQHAANKKGSSGRAVQLSTNYFKMLTAPNWAVYQYQVDFSNEEERPAFVKRAWFRDAVRNHPKFKGGYLFSGSILFSIHALTVKKEVLSFTIQDKNTGNPINVSVRLTGEVKSGDLQYLQIFNVLLRKVMENLNLKMFGRKFYDPQAKVEIPQHNIQLWPGYITSIRQNEQHVQMVAEITYKVLRTDTVYDLLKRCADVHGAGWKKIFKEKILGQVVMTPYNNRTYRISDMDEKTTPNSQFKLKNDESTTYVMYYKSHYNILIRDVKQPTLVARPTEKDIRGGRTQLITLIPEVCVMTGIDDDMRSNKRFTQDLAKYTRVEPEQRIDRLLKFNRRLQQKAAETKDFQDWNVQFSPKLVEVQGRVLLPEKIIAGGGQSCSAGQDADWTNFFKSRPMYSIANAQSIAVVVPRNLRGDCDQHFLPTIQRAASGLAFRIPPPVVIEIESDNTRHVLEGIENYISKRGPPSLMIFIFNNEREERYNAVKRHCSIHRAINTQVVLKKSVLPKHNDRSPRPTMNLSIATKIAIQMNCKLGGAPWAVEKPACLQNVMFIGYDTCHDPMNRSNSWGAFVASLNENFNLWFSASANHKKGEELSSHMEKDIKSALEKYKRINNKLPSKIIMYRDGVGEGQLAEVYKIEVEKIKKALTQVYSNKSWKLGYCIVTKRINTRIFANGKNPSAGTIVDDVITNPDFYDFFLVSQSVRQGTASPTYYNVISDNLGLSVDEFQRITYKMTHLYFNWTGTVAVPAPCQYAHKLSLLVSKHLQKPPNEDLCTRLFFL